MIRLAPGHGVGALGGMSGRAWVLVARPVGACCLVLKALDTVLLHLSLSLRVCKL